MKKDLIKRIRTELGLTQSQFAQASGINSFQQVSGLEAGRRKVGFSLLNRIICNLASNGYLVSLDITITVNDQKI
jgi:transcriptional regulator with XRE-family HTH domain